MALPDSNTGLTNDLKSSTIISAFSILGLY